MDVATQRVRLWNALFRFLKKSKGGLLEHMLLWFVESKRPIKVNRMSDYVMDSAFNYLNDNKVRLRYRPLRLLVDSGAYTAARRNLSLDPCRIIEIQERLGADIVIPLDYPFMPNMNLFEMRKRLLKTIENTRLWSEVMSPKIEIMPVVHAIGKKELLKTVRTLAEICGNSKYMGIGTIIDTTSDLRGFLGDRQPRRTLIDSLITSMEVIKEYGFGVHVTGFGSSPLTLHLAIYLGVDSTDSSGYRRKAAYGKIILPHTGERYVGSGKAKFGVVKPSPSEIEYLRSRCGCPICRRDPYLLWRDWRARALHNEWVIKATRNIGLRLREEGLDIYEHYLDRLFANSWLGYLWRYAKTRIKYTNIYRC